MLSFLLRCCKRPLRPCCTVRSASILSSDTSKKRSSNSTRREMSSDDDCPLPKQERPLIAAEHVPAKMTSVYPTEEFRAVVNGRSKRALGNFFGLTNFGVNYTTLQPGAASALQHCHAKQDEFVYVLQGTATCRLGNQEFEIKAGECIGFPKGRKVGHCIVNRSDSPVVYLEIGDRTVGDVVEYPEVDLKCAMDDSGQWKFLHRDGKPYETK